MTNVVAPLPVRYFLRVPNVGDMANSNVVSSVSKRPVRWSSDGDEPHLLAIGSVLSGATSGSRVWGTGLMHPDFGLGDVQGRNIFALRGPGTGDALRTAGIAFGDVPFGDPGFLAAKCLGIARASRPRYRMGLVSHYVDRGHPEICALLAEEGVADLNVHEAPDLFLRNMADCEVIVSSSLHGLIFADFSLGLPNLWIRASDDIAGGDFKFQDWFATTSRPQAQVHKLSAGETAADLVARAQVHELTIDAEALIGAFPKDFDVTADATKCWRGVDLCRASSLPIFLISFNRGAMLRQVVAGLRSLETPVDIIVHDNGSTDAETIAILLDLESEGICVYRYPPINDADDLNQVNESVSRYFADWCEPGRYAVSDCDVDLSVADPTVFQVYDELLNIFRKVECVGPMLRIRDIPRRYPLRNRALNRHIEQFWQHEPRAVQTSACKVAIQEALIDTTMALHRAGEPFRRLKQGVRVYEPFEARHLDWYEQGGIYAETAKDAISHWNNPAETVRFGGEALEYKEFYTVFRGIAGELEIRIESLSEDQSMTMPPPDPNAIPRIGFVDADSNERQFYVSQTESLRADGDSDIARWSQPAAHQSGWADRGKLLVGMLKPGESVFEFGAGRSVVSSMLPPDSIYKASDVAPLSDAVMHYDLNGETLPAIDGFSVALFSGVLEYVHDLARLGRFLSQHFPSVICSYSVATNMGSESIERRRYSGWFTDLDEAAFMALFDGAGFRMTERLTWGEQVLFRFDGTASRS